MDRMHSRWTILGGYLREYGSGDPSQAKNLPEPDLDSSEPQERRLARCPARYDKALSPVEHALLARLCIFRFGTTIERLHGVFSTGNNAEITGPLKGLSIKDFDKTLLHLLRLHLVLESRSGEFTAHPAVRDHFYRVFSNARILHQAIRRHFSSLADVPGAGLPTAPETIDLLEELVYHTLKAGTSTKRGRYITRDWEAINTWPGILAITADAFVSCRSFRDVRILAALCGVTAPSVILMQSKRPLIPMTIGG